MSEKKEVIRVGRPTQTDDVVIEKKRKCYESSCQTDVVPELLNPSRKILDLQTRNTRRKTHMSMIGGHPDDPLHEQQKELGLLPSDLNNGLRQIRASIAI